MSTQRRNHEEAYCDACIKELGQKEGLREMFSAIAVYKDLGKKFFQTPQDGTKQITWKQEEVPEKSKIFLHSFIKVLKKVKFQKNHEHCSLSVTKHNFFSFFLCFFLKK